MPSKDVTVLRLQAPAICPLLELHYYSRVCPEFVGCAALNVHASTGIAVGTSTVVRYTVDTVIVHTVQYICR